MGEVMEMQVVQGVEEVMVREIGGKGVRGEMLLEEDGFLGFLECWGILLGRLEIYLIGFLVGLEDQHQKEEEKEVGRTEGETEEEIEGEIEEETETGIDMIQKMEDKDLEIWEMEGRTEEAGDLEEMKVEEI
jgi:hypothetical protein